jgi:phosphoglucomutase
VLCWLSIIAFKNQDVTADTLVSVSDIVNDHWRTFGRNYYTRYDYESVDSNAANNVMKTVQDLIQSLKKGSILSNSQKTAQYSVDFADNFTYKGIA